MVDLFTATTSLAEVGAQAQDEDDPAKDHQHPDRGLLSGRRDGWQRERRHECGHQQAATYACYRQPDIGPPTVFAFVKASQQEVEETSRDRHSLFFILMDDQPAVDEHRLS